MKSRLPKGMGGGQNMNQMVKQAQKIQDQMTKKQEEIEEREFSTAVGGGAVEVVVTGKKEIKQLKIKPEVVDSDDVEMLEDLLISAFNEVMRKVDEETEEEMGKITGGMSIPGMPGMF